MGILVASKAYGVIDDESLNAMAEYRYQQSEKRRLAAEAARVEELKHIHQLDMNSLLKTLADDEEAIAEVVVVYKNGVKDRFIAPKVDEAESSQPTVIQATPVAPSSSPSLTNDGSWIEGRRYAGQRVW